MLINYNSNERAQIIVNTRNADLLMALSDTSVIKCFETENIDLGITHVQNNLAQEICVNYKSMTATYSEILSDLGIDFCLFGVKTSKEIRAAMTFLPARIITDNIAFTKKITQ